MDGVFGLNILALQMLVIPVATEIKRQGHLKNNLGFFVWDKESISFSEDQDLTISFMVTPQ